MTADATNSSRGQVDCGRVAREEILEGYLLGRLSEADRDAFEAHYFECARCFDDLRALEAIRRELAREGAAFEPKAARPFVGWAAAAGLAAALVLAVGIVLWMRAPVPPGDVEHPTARVPAPPEPITETGRPEGPAPPVASAPSLEQLARFDPPPYEPLTLRGTPDSPTARFQRGMERYRKAEYAAAVADLRAAVELDPAAAHSRFFLGISHLMLGQDDAAIEQLRATIALGDSAYLEEAHWFLAKAFLRRNDLPAAETQLQTLIQLRGSGTAEARQLLTELQQLSASP